VLAIYWIGCLGVIAVGLDRLYPEVRARTFEATAPALATVASLPVEAQGRRATPYRNCAAAHAAGIYDIPVGSPMYAERQDGDGDGLACEPPP
jgi:hypothetical protein